ncbi:MAG: hypothetical protein HFH68_07210 [Lachnospiraceae bacterium]|nr:hypothetical protein [Lachnospiraceae bacterium]
MDEYGKNSKMSLDEVLELYNRQDGGDEKDDTAIYEDSQEIQEKPLPVNIERKPVHRRRRGASFAEACSWFQTICWLNIPVFGLFYMFVLLIRKKTSRHKKNFIIGYIMYKALVWLLAIVLLYWLYKTGIGFIDGILKYVA